MGKGTRVRATRTRSQTMARRAATRMMYQDAQEAGPVRLFAGLLKSGRNRHERRRDAARARRHAH